MRYKLNFGFILFIIIPVLLLFLSSCTEKIEDNIIQKLITISITREIPQDGEYFVSKPLKMLCFNNKIYILDRRFFRVLVFTENGYSHSIGNPGQGPGEISHPISFEILKNNIYVANIPNRIEVFDLLGNYKKTIKLKIKKRSISSFWDFTVYNDKFYFSIDIGNIIVQRYSLDGDYIDDFISKGSEFDFQKYNKKYILSNPYNIYVVPEKNMLILFNQFNGDVEVFDLLNRNSLKKFQKYDSIISKKALSIKDNLKSSKSDKTELEVKSFILLRSVLDKDNNRLLITPSQISLKKGAKRNLMYTYEFNRDTIEKNTLNFTNSETKYIRFCYPQKRKLIVLDDELNLYIGELK